MSCSGCVSTPTTPPISQQHLSQLEDALQRVRVHTHHTPHQPATPVAAGGCAAAGACPHPPHPPSASNTCRSWRMRCSGCVSTPTTPLISQQHLSQLEDALQRVRVHTRHWEWDD
jgi:Fe-S cluster biogenesis protein NfuA